MKKLALFLAILAILSGSCTTRATNSAPEVPTAEASTLQPPIVANWETLNVGEPLGPECPIHVDVFYPGSDQATLTLEWTSELVVERVYDGKPGTFRWFPKDPQTLVDKINAATEDARKNTHVFYGGVLNLERVGVTDLGLITISSGRENPYEFECRGFLLREIVVSFELSEGWTTNYDNNDMPLSFEYVRGNNKVWLRYNLGFLFTGYPETNGQFARADTMNILDLDATQAIGGYVLTGDVGTDKVLAEMQKLPFVAIKGGLLFPTMPALLNN